MQNVSTEFGEVLNRHGKKLIQITTEGWKIFGAKMWEKQKKIGDEAKP